MSRKRSDQGRVSVSRAGEWDPGNVVGIDPHKLSLSATVLDTRGGVVAVGHFRVSGEGHRALEAWALAFGPVARWGVEGASSWGRHTAAFLSGRGYDVRDVCANRTPRVDRARQRGKSDALDCERIARETLAHPLLPRAFKRAGQDHGVDETHELLALWHNQRFSIRKSRQHLVNEAETMLSALPLELREQLPVTKAVRPRLRALVGIDRRGRDDRPTVLRLALLERYRAQIAELDAQERAIGRELERLVKASGSTLGELCGLSTRSVAELLVEVGDPRRFTRGGFGRFTGTAPLVVSTGEGAGDPVRHRYNPGGNRRVNCATDRALGRGYGHRHAGAGEDQRRDHLPVGEVGVGDQRDPGHAARLHRHPGDDERPFAETRDERPGDLRDEDCRSTPGHQPQPGGERPVVQPVLQELRHEERGAER
jgi:transposase